MPVILPEPKVGFPQDFQHCARIIKAGSKSFHFASLMLPSEIRQAAFATYAFCRLADDEIDLGEDPVTAIEMLSERLDLIYLGRPIDNPIDRAFSYIVSTYALPRELPNALLEGMLWDTQQRRYQSLEDLLDYAARVAGSVGAMMTVLMGNRSSLAVARACDLGIAMQLTNIARDIGEDARAGRIYLPLDWFEEVGMDVQDFIAQPDSNVAIQGLTKRLLDAAEPLYERGLGGVSLLPKPCQTSIRAAGEIYRDIGTEIARNGYDSVSRRAVISKARKAQLLCKAALVTSEDSSVASPTTASIFLVEAVLDIDQKKLSPISPTRVNWVIDLFMRLEQRQTIV